jgi:hypothetical protein
VLKLGENKLSMVDDVKDLGITMDNKLKFILHINHMIAKAFNRSNLILKCFLSKNVETLIRAFIVYVRPTCNALPVPAGSNEYKVETNALYSCEVCLSPTYLASFLEQ